MCIRDRDYPSGKHIGIVKAPAIFSSGEAEFGPSGYPGEYTREVLKEYGFDDAKIDELREQGLVTEEDQWDKDQYNMEKQMCIRDSIICAAWTYVPTSLLNE